MAVIFGAGLGSAIVVTVALAMGRGGEEASLETTFLAGINLIMWLLVDLAVPLTHACALRLSRGFQVILEPPNLLVAVA
jgi:hypothetical protein